MATLFVGISELVSPLPDETDTHEPIVLHEDAALLVKEGSIIASGPASDVRCDDRAKGADTVDLGGRAVVPGLVDSHTHVVFAGERIDEMARRARGESYEEIAKAGGGIVSSMTTLANATEEELVALAHPRLEAMLACGVTTVEVKSGYGLIPQQELKQLRAIQRLGEQTPIDLLPTVLAHVIPPAQRDDRERFVRLFAKQVIARAAEEGFARYCDVFVESGAYDVDEARLLVAEARSCGLDIKLHVDQLRDGGGASLAAELNALSADHLEHTSQDGRRALAEAGVVATILPGCALYLGKGPWPDGRALRDAGCEVAVATDCNPGSAMISDLPLCATMAATRCGLTVEEALWGITRGGAKALGLEDRGSLRAGERADFVLIDHHDWRALLYRPANPPIAAVAIGGQWVIGDPAA